LGGLDRWESPELCASEEPGEGQVLSLSF
jgi:hypothetical protein